MATSKGTFESRGSTIYISPPKICSHPITASPFSITRDESLLKCTQIDATVSEKVPVVAGILSE